jgi:hypothetical protein
MSGLKFSWANYKPVYLPTIAYRQIQGIGVTAHVVY